MKRIAIIVLALVLLLGLGAMPVMAAKGDTPANDEPFTLYLYEKDVDWNIVWDGAWGKMSFELDGATLDFVFNGHKLDKKTDYSLIYYPEPQTTWPHPVEVIASGTSNGGGNIHLAGSADLGVSSGIKIWLVLSDDIVNGKLSGWNPTEYLLEHNSIPNPEL